MKKAFSVDEDYDQQLDDSPIAEDEKLKASEQVLARGGTNIARTVAPTSVQFKDDYFKLNEIYERVLYIERWPIEVEPNWLRDIFQYQRAIDIALYYQPLPVKSLLQKLRSKSARESAEIEKDEQEGNPIDFARMQRLEDSLTLQEMLQRGETKPFQVAILVAIRANSLKELNEITDHIEKAIDSIGAGTRRAALRQRDGFLSVLPFGRNYVADGYSTRNMQTQGAQYSFPFANADLTHPDGIWYGVNRSTNSNVILDRFRLQSAHSIVLGASGSGKSYGAKLEMMRALMHDIPVMVIDPDAECERLAEYVGGQFITIGPNSPDRINVMDFSHAADAVEDQLTPKIQSILKLLGSMMNPEGEGYGLNAEQVQILDQLLREVYIDFGYTQDARTQANAQRDRMPVLSDLRTRIQRFISESEHNPRAQGMMSEIVASMGPYCVGGTFESLFDQHTTVDLKEDFVVFNIKPLTVARSAHLMTLGMHSVLEFVWNTTMNRAQLLSGKPRFLFVDEAHVMMRSHESAQFLEDMMRRARKCHVGVTVLTQDPEDFVRPDRPQGKLIFANSSLQVLLRMKRQSLEQLQELMGLDDSEVNHLAQAQRGEGILFAMNDRVWITMDTASPKEHEAVTSNPEEVKEIHRKKMAQAQAQVIENSQLPVAVQQDYLQIPQAPQHALPSAPNVLQHQPLRNDVPQLPQQTGQMVDPFENQNNVNIDRQRSPMPQTSQRPPGARPSGPRISTLQKPEPVSQIGPPVKVNQPLKKNVPPKPLDAPKPIQRQPQAPTPPSQDDRFSR